MRLTAATVWRPFLVPANVSSPQYCDVTNFMSFIILWHGDGAFYGLAFDWITGNIYVVANGGYILACDGTTGKNFQCASVLTDQGSLWGGIALDPVEG